MKDVAGSGKTPYGPVCGDLARGHSKMFSVMLVLILTALVAFAAFLISDILSFKSNAAYEESFSVFSFMNSKESGIENAMANNSSSEGIGTPLSSLNGSDEAKGSLSGDDIAGDTGKQPDPTVGANSSLNNALILTGQTDGTVATTIKPSGSDSHKSDKNKKHSSSKNNIQVKKDIQVNRDDASPPSTAVEDQSQLNQSQNRINLSSNISLNLSASEPKMNATEIPSYNSRPEDTDSFGNSSVNSFADSSGNSSANPDALSQLDMNSTTTSDPNAFNADLTPAADLPENLNVSDLSSADGETSNLDVNAAGGIEEEVQVEPTVQVVLPIQELSRENSVPLGDDEDLGLDSSDEGISDGLVDFNSDIDTNDVEVFADPVETDDGADDGSLPLDDVSSKPQYPEHSMTANREWPANSQEEPAQFASSQEDRSVKGDLDFAEPTSKVVPADKSSSKWKGAENKRLSSREKRDKIAKSKRPTPPARPARTRPVRPARDNSRN